MQVIMREDVQSVGKMGELINVKRGFARNYLFPQNLAVEANTKNVKQLEHIKKSIEKRKIKRDKERLELIERLKNISITIAKPVGDNDKLYGAVTSKDIVNGLTVEGITNIDKKQIIIEEPIKQLGIYNIKVKLGADAFSELKIWVVAKD